MKRGINLKLPKKKPSQAGKKALYYSIIVLIVTFSIGVGVVGYSLLLDSNLRTLYEERDGLRSQILSQNTKYFKLQDTHTRLKNIQSILSGRLKAIDKVDNIASILPDNTKVLSVSTDVMDITYSVTSPDLSKINSMLEEKLLALAAEKEKSVKTVELTSLIFDADERIYRLTFKVKF